MRAQLTAWASLTLVTLFGALTLNISLGQLGLSAISLGEPHELEYGEAIIYAHAGRLVRGEPLYQPLDRPPYTVVAYTPIYYGIAAFLQATFGPGFVAGRVVSCLAGLSTVILVALITVRTAGDWRPGLIAVLQFVALGFPGRPPWYALYKEDLLGVALSLSAITLLLSGTARWHLMLAALLAGLAFLTKQTFLAAFVAGAVWLWTRDQTRAGAFIACWVILVVCTGATCELLMPGFLANTVLGNIVPFTGDALINNLRLFVTFLGGAMAVAAGYALLRIGVGGAGVDLRVLYCAATLLPLVGLGKIGSNHNYWIETAASSAVLASLGLWEARRRWLARGDMRVLVPPVLLLASAVWVTSFFGLPALAVRSAVGSESAATAAFHQVVERVRAEPRAVLADPLDVVALAGREIEFEPYLFSVLATEGHWDPGPIVRRICEREIGLVVLGNPLESPGRSYQGYAFWPPSVLAALREMMELESERAGRFLYVPALTPPDALPAPCAAQRAAGGA